MIKQLVLLFLVAATVLGMVMLFTYDLINPLDHLHGHPAIFQADGSPTACASRLDPH